VIALAGGNPSDESHIIKLPFTARVYKTLVQGGHYNAKEKKVEGRLSMTRLTIVVDPPLAFASKFYAAIRSDILLWAVGEGSFVVVALLEALFGDDKERLTSQLKKYQKSLEDQREDNKGTKIVLEMIAKF
jgi:pumilio homology domain family member 6